MSDNVAPYLHLRDCRECGKPAKYDITMRHGMEYPACEKCVAYLLDQAYEYDGDHGNVTVYQIGVASETLTVEPRP